MAKTTFLIGLLFLLVFLTFAECRGGGRGGGGRGGSRGGGRSSHSYGSHSYGSHSSGSHSNSKPSSSWWSWGSSSSSSGSSHSYPSSSSGLSGSGHSSSGSSHSYPSSSTGLSGSGSGKSNYPYSSGNNYWHPSRTGSGSGHYNPSWTGQSYYTPTYYSMPQHVYVTEYRNSGSRYSDVLTGLTLYNLGRSHNHYHEHYYNDDYYNRRYATSHNSNNYNTNSNSQDTATCRLKIKDHGSVETLKIPCEIVSTFADESKKVSKSKSVNTTVCVTKATVVNSTLPSPSVMVGPNTTTVSTNSSHKVLNNSSVSPEVTMLVEPLINKNTNATSIENNTESVVNMTGATENYSIMPEIYSKIVSNMQNVTNYVSALNKTTSGIQETPKQTVVNVTTCTTTTTASTTDPLTVKGPTVDPSGKECIVEIQTKESLFSDKIDCSTLMKYAKMPAPREDESNLMPSRGQLKSWLSNPPWWMSAFIAV